MKCPHCEKNIKIPSFNMEKTTTNCKCGTTITLAAGIFTGAVLDWEVPDRSKEQLSRNMSTHTRKLLGY